MVETNVKLKTDIQSLNPGSEFIDLYILDASMLKNSSNQSGNISYFIPGTINNSVTVYFGGIAYHPLPVEFSGMEISGDGTLPRPKMKVANGSSTFVGLISSFNDGIGATVKRIRTFKKYLDGQPSADSSVQITDIFTIEQKTAHNNIYIEWELVSPMDVGTRKIPKGQITSYCQHRYRFYSNGTWNNSNPTCIYSGSNYFKEDGSPTTNASEDRCGKKLYDCELRFGENNQLPFKGFPGIGSVGRAYR